MFAAPIAPSAAQAATPIVDQAFTGPGNLNALINECCRFVAQTFTAGITGTLVGVNIDICAECVSTTSPLHVAIRTVGADGFPTGTVLGEATIDPPPPSLSEFIAFPQVISVVDGVQYAIVVNYPEGPPPGNAQGVWLGATGDQYSRGHALASFDDGLVWFESLVGSDLFFRTYVVARLPAPATKADCKRGAWRNFADEDAVAFRNQGQCVAFVVRASK